MVISNFYPIVGGAERQAQNLAQKLMEQGEKVFIFTRKQKHCPSFENINGLPVYRLLTLTKTTRLSSLMFNLHLFWSLIKFRQNYEIIHCHLLSTSVVVSLLVAKLFRKKVIVKLGGGGTSGDVWNIQNKALQGKWKFNFIAQNVAWFMVPSQEIKGELQAVGVKEAKIKIIPNGVDIKRFYILNINERIILKQKMGFNDKNIIIYIGRMSPEKNVNILLEAFKEIGDKFDKWILLLVGEGPLKNEYLIWTANNQLSRKIFFTGNVPEVNQYLQISDIFVLPSLFEGLPNALLEAMASGVLVVSSATGGVKDLVKDGENGFLFGNNNKNELKQKLEKTMLISSDKKEMIIKKARQTVEQNYSLDWVVSKYLELYKGLV